MCEKLLEGSLSVHNRTPPLPVSMWYLEGLPVASAGVNGAGKPTAQTSEPGVRWDSTPLPQFKTVRVGL